MSVSPTAMIAGMNLNQQAQPAAQEEPAAQAEAEAAAQEDSSMYQWDEQPKPRRHRRSRREEKLVDDEAEEDSAEESEDESAGRRSKRSSGSSKSSKSMISRNGVFLGMNGEVQLPQEFNAFSQALEAESDRCAADIGFMIAQARPVTAEDLSIKIPNAAGGERAVLNKRRAINQTVLNIYEEDKNMGAAKRRKEEFLLKLADQKHDCLLAEARLKLSTEKQAARVIRKAERIYEENDDDDIMEKMAANRHAVELVAEKVNLYPQAQRKLKRGAVPQDKFSMY